MSELTEWQNRIEVAVGCHELTAPRLFTIMRDKTNELQKQIDAFESIAKTVDPDNLPHKTERNLVLLVGGPALGYIRNDLSGDTYFYTLAATKYAKLTSSDKYITQKDLMELFK